MRHKPNLKKTTTKIIHQYKFENFQFRQLFSVKYLNVLPVTLEKITFRARNILQKFLLLFGPFYTPILGSIFEKQFFQPNFFFFEIGT